jgi:hypothetical protein
MNPSTPTTPSVPSVPSTRATPATPDQPIQETAGGSTTDAIGGWFAAEYFAAAQAEIATAPAPRRLELLRAFALDWSRFCRDNRAAARVQIARDKLALHRQKSQDRKQKQPRRPL